MYLREVNRHLALICILREDSFDKQGLIDYNFGCFRKAIQQVFDIKKQAAAARAKTNATRAFPHANGIAEGATS